MNVKKVEKAKSLLKCGAVMTIERGDLVTFRAITNR